MIRGVCLPAASAKCWGRWLRTLGVVAAPPTQMIASTDVKSVVGREFQEATGFASKVGGRQGGVRSRWACLHRPRSVGGREFHEPTGFASKVGGWQGGVRSLRACLYRHSPTRERYGAAGPAPEYSVHGAGQALRQAQGRQGRRAAKITGMVRLVKLMWTCNDKFSFNGDPE
jgi:hypothetical protein